MSTAEEKIIIGRPLLVTVISYFHIVVGFVFLLALLIAVYYTFADQPALYSFFENYKLIGYTPMWLIITVGLVAAIGISSGFGMLKGAKWAWHIAGFYYIFNIFRNINAIFFIDRPLAIFPLEAVTSFINDPNLYYVKYIVRGSVFAFFYILMNTKKFRQFFRLTFERNMWVMIVEFLFFIIVATIITPYI